MKNSMIVVGILMMVLAGCTPPNPVGPGGCVLCAQQTQTALAQGTATATPTNDVVPIATATATMTATEVVVINTATATMTSTEVVTLPSPTATSTPDEVTITIEISGDVPGDFNLKYGTVDCCVVTWLYNNAAPATPATALDVNKKWTSLSMTKIDNTGESVTFQGDAAAGQILTIVLKRTRGGILNENWYTTYSNTVGHFGATISF